MEVIKQLLFIENMVGIYRSYLSYSIKAKSFIALRILMEITLTFVFSFVNHFLALQESNESRITAYIMLFFTFLEDFYNFIILISSVLQTQSSVGLLKRLKVVNETLQENVKYVSALRKRHLLFKILATLMLVIQVIVFIIRIAKSYIILDYSPSLIPFNSFLIMQFWINFRYFVENCIYFAFLLTLGTMIKYFDEKLKLIEKKVREQQHSIREEETDDWVIIFNHLALSGKHINSLFRFQVCTYFKTKYIIIKFSMLSYI